MRVIGKYHGRYAVEIDGEELMLTEKEYQERLGLQPELDFTEGVVGDESESPSDAASVAPTPKKGSTPKKEETPSDDDE
jgi:hypothetical protein